MSRAGSSRGSPPPAHRATDRAGERDLAALPARLDQIDAWIAQGLLDGTELNAADFQIAPNLALLLRFEDLAPFIEGRPAAQLAQRVAPDFPGQIPAVLPSAWLSPLRASGATAARSALSAAREMRLAMTGDASPSWASLRPDGGSLPSWRYGR